MKKEIIQIENLKCGGCANTIKNALLKLDQVRYVEININKSEVTIGFTGTSSRNDFTVVLGKLGYPEAGQGTAIQKVKSYVSCAIGKINS